jgi:hypothetical protein
VKETKIYCDHCGKVIERATEFVDIKINMHCNAVGTDLCQTCYGELYDLVLKFVGKGGDAITDCPEIEITECKDCYYCQESDTTNRIFCTYQDTEFETYLNDYCSNGTPKEKGGEK